MKPVKAWLLVWKDGDPEPSCSDYGPRYSAYTTRHAAESDRRELVLAKDCRIVRVEIREVPKKARKA